MNRSSILLLSLATLPMAAYAQSADAGVAAGDVSSSSQMQTAPQEQAAPIVRSAPDGRGMQSFPTITSTEPVAGVWLRTDPNSSVKTVSANENGVEFRVEHGRANVDVRHPADHTQILVDLPGGQVNVLKDGLYTFNAETNTVRTLKGESEAFPTGTPAGAKGIKVKEEHQLSFAPSPKGVRSVEVDPMRLSADLLPNGDGPRGDGARGYGAYGYPGYGYGPYGDGFYGGPYLAYGYPYGFGYGYGLGFGYYGGFRGGYGGGFRGGYGGFGGGRGGFRR